jgi:hypothetical protein
MIRTRRPLSQVVPFRAAWKLMPAFVPQRTNEAVQSFASINGGTFLNL